jgi:hypothetical protein
VRILAADIVDWTALGKVVFYSFVAGVGVTLCFSLAILGATRFSDMRRDGRAVEAGAFAVFGLAGLAISIAAVVVAIVVMTQK